MSRLIRMALVATVLAVGLATEAAAQRAPGARARMEALRRGWLGISYTEREDQRFVIDEVVPDSPAGRAGLQEGDTVVQWNGRTDAAAAVLDARLQPGDSVQLRVRRGGARDRDITVVVGERPRSYARMRGRGDDVIIINPGPLMEGLRIHVDSLGIHADSLQRRLRGLFRDSLGPRLRELERSIPDLRIEMGRGRGDRGVYGFEVGARSVAGAEFAELNEGLSEYFQAERGVLVLRVGPETPAARAGLQAGDVVVRANGFQIERIGDLRQAVSRARDRAVELDVIRKGQPRKLQMSWD